MKLLLIICLFIVVFVFGVFGQKKMDPLALTFPEKEQIPFRLNKDVSW